MASKNWNWRSTFRAAQTAVGIAETAYKLYTKTQTVPKNSTGSLSSAASSSFYRVKVGNNPRKIMAQYRRWKKRRNAILRSGIPAAFPGVNSSGRVFRVRRIAGFPFAVQANSQQFSSNQFVWGPSPNRIRDYQRYAWDLNAYLSLDNFMGVQVHWHSFELNIRNNYSRVAELDLWVMYPKDDVATTYNAATGFPILSANDMFSPTPTPSFQQCTPPAMVLGFEMQAENQTGVPTQSMGSDDWTRYCGDSLVHRQLFKIKKRGNWILAPGATLRIKCWCRGYLYDPYGPPFQAAGTGFMDNPTNPSDSWAVLKMQGPQFCLRVRGLPVHDGSTENEATFVASGQTMGSAALDVVFQSEVCVSPFYSTVAFSDANETYTPGQTVPTMTLANEQAANSLVSTYPVGPPHAPPT